MTKKINKGNEKNKQHQNDQGVAKLVEYYDHELKKAVEILNDLDILTEDNLAKIFDDELETMAGLSEMYQLTTGRKMRDVRQITLDNMLSEITTVFDNEINLVKINDRLKGCENISDCFIQFVKSEFSGNQEPNSMHNFMCFFQIFKIYLLLDLKKTLNSGAVQIVIKDINEMNSEAQYAC